MYNRHYRAGQTDNPTHGYAQIHSEFDANHKYTYFLGPLKFLSGRLKRLDKMNVGDGYKKRKYITRPTIPFLGRNI